MKSFANLTTALTAASCALLGNNTQAQDDDEWSFDSAILYYDESAGRVKATEGIFSVSKSFQSDEALNLKVTVDSLTGASPSGAVPQTTVQTFTRASGKSSYTVEAGQTPLDNTFKDTRVQLNGQWRQPLAENYNISTGVHLSKEYDYFSLGLNANLATALNQQNTTLSLGFSFSHDSITPEGGRPIPFVSMARLSDNKPFDPRQHKLSRQSGDGNKNVLDLLLGVTQVINRHTIMQFNYSYSTSNGYHSDPFKLLSVVDSNGQSQNQIFENRPDERTKHSYYWQTKRHFSGVVSFSEIVADVSYRYMHDDWGIKSHTIDHKLRFTLAKGDYLEPHLRFYQQAAADFYRPFLPYQHSLPAFASADLRIGAFSAYTVGIKYAMTLASGNRLAYRLAFYQQTPTNRNINLPGVLNQYSLNPKLSALIAQVSYSF